MTDDLSGLVAELESLYRALGAALGAEPADGPDRSTVTRTADIWCAHHRRGHRPDQWTQVCMGGPDPRIAGGAGWARPTLTATTKTGQGGRSVPSSRPPLDLSILTGQEEIWTAATELVADLRHRLGHARRERGMSALAHVPMLVDQLTEGGAEPRWLTMGIARLDQARTRAREALDMDLRPMRLDPCPSDRQPYTAAWAGQDWEPLAEFVDGVCREYDWAASAAWTTTRRRHNPDAGPVDVWRPARLYVRNPTAPVESEAAAIRCPGCRRVWAGAAGRAELFDLIHSERKSA